jgi:hypothetical protein
LALAAIAARVAETPFADWAAGSSWAYPAANVAHLLGLVLVIGGIGLVDLRLMGLFRRLPLQPLADALTPLAIAGILLLATSGSVLFAADAAALAQSDTFRTKLVLIALALANAIAFRLLYGRSPADPPPVSARLMAAASVLLWLSVGTLGRMIAYS